MTILQKTRNILTALIMLAFCALLIYLPEDGSGLVLMILSFSLVIYGIRTLNYYFSMARHMVEGRGILYLGIIILDLGIFSVTVADNSDFFVIVYLLTIYLFGGIVDILRAFEAKNLSASSWKFKLSSGIVNIIIALIALISSTFFKSPRVLVYIYCAGLVYSAIARIITVFRKSAIVYIQ